MIKTFGLLSKRHDLTDAAFHEHWSTTHRAHAVKITSIRRYVQFHIDETAAVPGFANSGLNGVPENWWDDVEAATSLGRNPEYTENAGPDEAFFIGRKGRVVTTERVRLETLDFATTEPGPKVMVFLAANGTDAIEPAAVEAWLAGPWSDRIAAIPGIVRHVDAVAVADGPRSDYAAVAQLWWSDTASLDAAGDDLRALAQSLAESPFDRNGSAAAVGHELRVVWPERIGR